MIPVEQTHAGLDEQGRPHGNCFAACVASILECSLDDLPEIRVDEDDHDKRMNDALARDFGVYFVSWRLCPLGTTPVWIGDWSIPERGYWIAGVPSLNLPPDPETAWPRWHAVVMLGHEIAHDPSTKVKRTGFDDGPVYYATVFVPLDPCARALGEVALDRLSAATP